MKRIKLWEEMSEDLGSFSEINHKNYYEWIESHKKDKFSEKEYRDVEGFFSNDFDWTVSRSSTGHVLVGKMTTSESKAVFEFRKFEDYWYTISIFLSLKSDSKEANLGADFSGISITGKKSDTGSEPDSFGRPFSKGVYDSKLLCDEWNGLLKCIEWLKRFKCFEG